MRLLVGVFSWLGLFGLDLGFNTVQGTGEFGIDWLAMESRLRTVSDDDADDLTKFEAEPFGKRHRFGKQQMPAFLVQPCWMWRGLIDGLLSAIGQKSHPAAAVEDGNGDWLAVAPSAVVRIASEVMLDAGDFDPCAGMTSAEGIEAAFNIDLGGRSEVFVGPAAGEFWMGWMWGHGFHLDVVGSCSHVTRERWPVLR